MGARLAPQVNGIEVAIRTHWIFIWEGYK